MHSLPTSSPLYEAKTARISGGLTLATSAIKQGDCKSCFVSSTKLSTTSIFLKAYTQAHIQEMELDLEVLCLLFHPSMVLLVQHFLVEG